MPEPADYERFAASHPPDSEVHAILREKKITGFMVEVEGSGLRGRINKEDIGEDEDDRELRFKYTEPGERLRCYVRRVNAQHQEIMLTMIDPATDPWRQIPEDVDIGARVTGRVNDVLGDTFLLAIAPGVEGTMEREELAWEGQPVAEPTVGDTLDVAVMDIRRGARKLVLSRRRISHRPSRFFVSRDVDWPRVCAEDVSSVEERSFRRRLLFELSCAGVVVGDVAEPEVDERPDMEWSSCGTT